MPEDPGEPTLQGRSASASPPEWMEKLQRDKPRGCDSTLDDGELGRQLFTWFGGIPFLGGGKPVGMGPERHCSYPDVEGGETGLDISGFCIKEQPTSGKGVGGGINLIWSKPYGRGVLM